MKRTHLGVAAIAALVLPAPLGAQPENTASLIDLADVDLDLSDFPSEPQTYAIHMHGRSYDRGSPFPLETTLTLRTSYDDAGRLVLDDTLDFMGRTFAFNLTCDPSPTLPLVEGRLRMSHTAASLEATIRHDDPADTLFVTIGDQEKTTTIPFPDHTLTQSALLRIASRLPDTPGRTYAFAAFCPLSELTPEVPENADRCTITCRGTRTVTIDDQAVECTEFVTNFEGNLTLLVDDTNTLRKIVADHAQTEMILTTPEPALATANDED